MDLYFVMIRTLALILLFVTYAFGIGEFCVYDQHCGPEEKCRPVSTARGVVKKCVNALLPTCITIRDCKWWLGFKCHKKECRFLGIG